MQKMRAAGTELPQLLQFLAFSGEPFPRRSPRRDEGVPRATVPTKCYAGQYEYHKWYNDPIYKKQGPRPFYKRYFRRRHGQTRSEPKVMVD